MFEQLEALVMELQKLGVAYTLTVGIPNEEKTHCWNNLQDKEEILDMIEIQKDALVQTAEQLGISESVLFYED